MNVLQPFGFLIFFNIFLVNSSSTNYAPKMEEIHIKTMSSTKYLVYECKFRCGGWADRLKGIMSVYALSLLTNRHFIIDIRSPCNFSHLFVPNEIDWLPPIGIDLKRKRIYKDCLNSFEPRCIEKFLIGDKKIFDEKILTLKINQEWLTFFSRNIYFQSQILKLGFNSTKEFEFHHIFHQFYQRLFKLAPSLENKYQKMKSNLNLNNRTQIYCAQIRIGGKLSNGKLDKVINEMNSTKLFWSFIREKFINKEVNADWRLFITSDFESVEKEAIKEFGLNRIIRINGVNSHIDKEGKHDANDCSKTEKPMLDFHFMRNCDKAIVSNSGFGILGMWSRKEPVKDAFVFYRGLFKPLTRTTMPFG